MDYYVFVMANQNRTLLIVWHSRTGAARQMAEAAQAGAHEVARALKASDRLSIIARRAQETSATEMLQADAYLFSAPENLGSLSGAMKEFFDCRYYDVVDQINGRPYGLMVSAGSDGTGAVRQAERICTGWRLKAVAPALIVKTNAQSAEAILAEKTITDTDRARCAELGGLLAALLL